MTTLEEDYLSLAALEEELVHARVYDPAKAHEYYLRTRHLRGRRRAAGVDFASRPGGQGDQGGTGGSSNAVLRKSRSEKLDAQIEELQGKVDRLRELIRMRVDKAKERAGVEKPDKKEESSTKDTKTSDKKAKDSKDKPLTEKQKREKREASKEQYEKEQRTSKVHEVQALQNTLKDLRERLAKLPKPANQQSNQTARTAVNNH